MTEFIHAATFALLAAISIISGLVGFKSLRSPEWSLMESFVALFIACITAYGAAAVIL